MAMITYVDIMYTDRSIVRKTLDKVHELPTTEVLFILISLYNGNNKVKNLEVCFDFDSYALCQKRDNSKDWVMLFGWDEDDYQWRETNCNVCDPMTIVDAPIGGMHAIFRGGQVTQEEWKIASEKFDKELVK